MLGKESKELENAIPVRPFDPLNQERLNLYDPETDDGESSTLSNQGLEQDAWESASNVTSELPLRDFVDRPLEDTRHSRDILAEMEEREREIIRETLLEDGLDDESLQQEDTLPQYEAVGQEEDIILEDGSGDEGVQEEDDGGGTEPSEEWFDGRPLPPPRWLAYEPGMAVHLGGVPFFVHHLLRVFV
jgi:hypothetical protein